MFAKLWQIKLSGNMIERILNRFGYYRSEMPAGSALTEAEVLDMFKTYGTNEMFLRFLRDLCARDIRLHFQTSTDREQQQIRGAHARTNYFISLIKKANDKRR